MDLFVCRAGAGSSWRPWSPALPIRRMAASSFTTGDQRLPIGRRPIFASVRGDRSSVQLLAVVLPSGGKVAVSDVDGTLTSYENEYPESLITGAQGQGAGRRARGLFRPGQQSYQPVYLTARGSVFTESTRKWLNDTGFPVGPLRPALNLITPAGRDHGRLQGQHDDRPAGFAGSPSPSAMATAPAMPRPPQASRRGHRSHLPQAAGYSSEIDPVIARGDAVGNDSYRLLVPTFSAYPRAP